MSLNHLNQPNTVGLLNPKFSTVSLTNQDTVILTASGVSVGTGVDTVLYNGNVLLLRGSNLSYDSKTGNINIPTSSGSGNYLVSYSISVPNNGVSGVRSSYVNCSDSTLPVVIAENNITGSATTPTKLTGSQTFYYSATTSCNLTLHCTQISGASINVDYSLCLNKLN